MCGIAGIFTPARPVDEARVRVMLACLEHRGPDDEGLFAAPGVALGARRLSIIDLEGGHQPMPAGEGITVSQNGEIYNFPELREELERDGELFHTRSDTEVIGRLYRRHGPRALERLSGMFAVALHDARTGELVLARDRSGIKPLFVAEIDGGVAYASELGALRAAGAVDGSPDPEALRVFALLGFVAGRASAFAGAWRVPPGEAHVFGADGQHRVVSFAATYAPVENGNAATGGVLARLGAAVDRHLLADVPVGLFLSGGLDSGAIAAALARRGAHAKAFTIGVPGTGHMDERAAAAGVARRFGLEHHVAELEAPDEDSMRELARAFDEPFADASAYATLGLARLARGHVKVVLSGTGGDETLSGYERYALPALLRRARWLPPGAARALQRAVERMRPTRRTAAGELMVRTAKLLDAALSPRPELAYARVVSAATRLWSPLMRGTPAEAEQVLDRLFATNDLRARRFDLAFGPAFDHRIYLPDDLLVKEDRATMAVGLEARVPFLDREWLGWTERAGERAKRPGGRPKGLLRAALAGVLSPAVLQRPKHGFAQPVSEWLRRPEMGWLEGLFARSGEAAGLDAKAAKLLLASHRSGAADAGEELWGAAMLALWHEEHATAAAAAPHPLRPAEVSAPPRLVRRAARPAPARTKVVRIISRMNVGGPAIHVSLLTAGLRDFGFDTLLVRGREGAFEGRMDDVARGYGVQPLSLPGLRREMHPLADVQAYRGLVELLRRERPAIVHTHTSKAGMLGRLAALQVGVPVILHTFHGHVLDGYFHPLVVRGIVAVERELARRSTRLIAVSRATAEDMVRIGVPAEKLLHIPLGLPIDPLFRLQRGRGNFRRSLGVPEGAPLVGIVARMAEVKRHEIFLEAAVRLKETDPGMHFAIVGGGEREAELRRLAEQKGLSDRVHFAGFRRDLDEILSDLDVSVLCSRSEGLPVSLIEAMAAAVPIVATDVGGVRELLGDSEAGVLVAPEDPGALAGAVRRVLGEPETAARIVRAGRTRAEIYRERHLLEAMARLYRELLGAPKPHHSQANEGLDRSPGASVWSVGNVPGPAGQP